MKRTPKTSPTKGSADNSQTPNVEPTKPRVKTTPRQTFDLSSLEATPPRTAEDIRRAFAQGRFAELKPEQM